MRLVRHPDADAFLRDTQDELERREAENNLILGVALRVRAEPPPAGSPAYFATARAGGELALAAMLTPAFPLALAAGAADAKVEAALDPLAADLLESGVPVSGVLGPEVLAASFAECWVRAMGSGVRVEMRQRIYALTEVQPVPEAPGEMRRAAEDDVDLVARWMAEFYAEALGERDVERGRRMATRRIPAGEVWLWDDGGPRAMAASARPTRHGIAVNDVYTPPEWRGRGYATACVAALSRRLLAEGRRFCVLYTDLANPTSNSIYARIGYRPLEDSSLVRFGG